MAITKDLRRRFQFFLKHAGYCTPPGRTACALALARAEQTIEATDLEFVTDDDSEQAYCYCDNPRCKYHEGSKHEWSTVYVRLVQPCADHGLDCRHAITLASRGGIAEPDAEYLRVIRAELASEAIARGLPEPTDDDQQPYEYDGHDDIGA